MSRTYRCSRLFYNSLMTKEKIKIWNHSVGHKQICIIFNEDVKLNCRAVRKWELSVFFANLLYTPTAQILHHLTTERLTEAAIYRTQIMILA